MLLKKKQVVVWSNKCGTRNTSLDKNTNTKYAKMMQWKEKQVVTWANEWRTHSSLSATTMVPCLLCTGSEQKYKYKTTQIHIWKKKKVIIQKSHTSFHVTQVQLAKSSRAINGGAIFSAVSSLKITSDYCFSIVTSQNAIVRFFGVIIALQNIKLFSSCTQKYRVDNERVLHTLGQVQNNALLKWNVFYTLNAH